MCSSNQTILCIFPAVPEIVYFAFPICVISIFSGFCISNLSILYLSWLYSLKLSIKEMGRMPWKLCLPVIYISYFGFVYLVFFAFVLFLNFRRRTRVAPQAGSEFKMQQQTHRKRALWPIYERFRCNHDDDDDHHRHHCLRDHCHHHHHDHLVNHDVFRKQQRMPTGSVCSNAC